MRNALSLRCFLGSFWGVCGCNFRILGNTNSGSIVEIESGLYELCARSYLSGSAKAQSEVIADSSPQDNARQQRSKN